MIFTLDPLALVVARMVVPEECCPMPTEPSSKGCTGGSFLVGDTFQVNVKSFLLDSLKFPKVYV